MSQRTFSQKAGCSLRTSFKVCELLTLLGLTANAVLANTVAVSIKMAPAARREDWQTMHHSKVRSSGQPNLPAWHVGACGGS